MSCNVRQRVGTALAAAEVSTSGVNLSAIKSWLNCRASGNDDWLAILFVKVNVEVVFFVKSLRFRFQKPFVNNCLMRL